MRYGGLLLCLFAIKVDLNVCTYIYIYTVQTILFMCFANFYEIFQYIIVKDLVILVSYN